MNSEFCALSTKLKAMHSGHLTKTEYRQLLEKRNVGEIYAYLKNTAYEPFMSDLNENDVHRGKLEECLERRNRDIYLKLYVFVDLNQRKLIRFFFMRDEIDAIKSVLRRCFNREQTFVVHMDNLKSEFFSRHSRINTELLLQSRDINSVAEACKNTEFYNILRHAALNSADYPTVCMMLDRLYFKNLWSAIGKYVKKSQQEQMKKYIGSQIDYLNIMWIYRCKRYFKLPPELIYTYLIPVYYRLSSGEIARMVEAADIEACEREIASGLYEDILDNRDDSFVIERNYMHIRYKNAKKAYKLFPQTMTEVFAFFDLCLIETNNLETIIEGVRYQTASELIRSYIYVD